MDTSIIYKAMLTLKERQDIKHTFTLNNVWSNERNRNKLALQAYLKELFNTVNEILYVDTEKGGNSYYLGNIEWYTNRRYYNICLTKHILYMNYDILELSFNIYK